MEAATALPVLFLFSCRNVDSEAALMGKWQKRREGYRGFSCSPGERLSLSLLVSASQRLSSLPPSLVLP